MSKTRKENPGPLVTAALALEEALERLQGVAREALRMPLDSQKNLDWTRSKLAELGQMDTDIEGRLKALMDALNNLGVMQAEELERLRARAAEFEARQNTFRELIGEYGGLRTESDELNNLVQQLVSSWREGGSKEAVSLETVVKKLDSIVERTQTLTQSADDKNFSDLSRQADSLRQQLASARNKLVLLGNRLGDPAGTGLPN